MDNSTPFSARIGSNTYEGAHDLLVYRGLPALQVGLDNAGVPTVTLDVRDEKGQIVAEVVERKIVSGDRERYAIETSPTEFRLIDSRDGRVLCAVLRTGENAVDVSADLYLPDGSRFSATADEMKVGTITFRGCTFKGVKVGIVLG